jgi:protein disulfide-isomerase A6
LDAVEHPVTAGKYGVKGYPTLKFFGKDNEITEYSGGRDEDSLVEFLNKECGTHRAPGGGLLPSAGLDSDLMNLAADFLTDKPIREEIIVKATERGNHISL